MKQDLSFAKEKIASARHLVAFTGAGISVESGIPPFRGPNGLWSRVDPVVFDIDFFLSNPEKTYQVVKELYETFSSAQPNPAHYALARAEEKGLLKAIITQNIDRLHQRAGSKKVVEFHGNGVQAICMNCGKIVPFSEDLLKDIPPYCPDCGGLLKPDFVFFGEPIPEEALRESLFQAQKSDVMLVIGTTGLIQPASQIPYLAKDAGAYIIEVNPEPSAYTHTITDFFLPEKASFGLPALFRF